MDLLFKLKNQAKKSKKRIILPEGEETRTLQAAEQILKDDLADILLIGNQDKINQLSKSHNLSYIHKSRIIDPNNNPDSSVYCDLLVSLRKSKGLSFEKAKKLILNPLYLAPLMIKNGDADGEVAGADNSTGDVLRPALQIIKTEPGCSLVSGAFLMHSHIASLGDNGTLFFADCAVNPNPSAEQLAEIAISTGKTAKALGGFEPRIALLSFSTKGSASHAMVEKVTTATALAQKLAPDLHIDGELQADAALIPSIGKKKCPQSDIAGKANVLIFPSLESGNISYKLVQRFGETEAIGPILQGMAAPVNDLSRGCSVEDIINLIIITCNQAIGM